jgi:hypothetical protein
MEQNVVLYRIPYVLFKLTANKRYIPATSAFPHRDIENNFVFIEHKFIFIFIPNIVQSDLHEVGWEAWTGLSWLRIETGGGLL